MIELTVETMVKIMAKRDFARAPAQGVPSEISAAASRDPRADGRMDGLGWIGHGLIDRVTGTRIN